MITPLFHKWSSGFFQYHTTISPSFLVGILAGITHTLSKAAFYSQLCSTSIILQFRAQPYDLCKSQTVDYFVSPLMNTLDSVILRKGSPLDTRLSLMGFPRPAARWVLSLLFSVYKRSPTRWEHLMFCGVSFSPWSPFCTTAQQLSLVFCGFRVVSAFATLLLTQEEGHDADVVLAQEKEGARR